MKKISLSIAFLMIGVIAFAQQALFGGSQLVSPEIHPDNTVSISIPGDPSGQYRYFQTAGAQGS